MLTICRSLVGNPECHPDRRANWRARPQGRGGKKGPEVRYKEGAALVPARKEDELRPYGSGDRAYVVGHGHMVLVGFLLRIFGRSDE